MVDGGNGIKLLQLRLFDISQHKHIPQLAKQRSNINLLSMLSTPPSENTFPIRITISH